MKVACYARVSTHDQQTLPLQLKAMEEYAKRREWTITERISEIGSGKDDNRPKREELLKKAYRREIDAILVWKLDRWGRSLADLVSTLKNLTDLKVGFISLTEAIDLTTPTGRALTGMLSVFAEFERDILRERIKAGIDQSRMNGKPHGRPRSALNKASEIAKMHAEGVSKSKIASTLGIGRTSVRRILSQPPAVTDQAVASQTPQQPKKLEAHLWLSVTNNSKFVRGMSRVRKEIEDAILYPYDAKKLKDDGQEYHLTIPYQNDADLDSMINDLFIEMETMADERNCSTEAIIKDRNSDRQWD